MSKRMIDSELIEALGTDIRFDGTGNVIVGKNLEVGGTTKLNGGLKPIHTFTWSITQDDFKLDYTLESLYETMEGAMGYTIFNGYLRIYVNGVGASQDYAIIGEYNALGGPLYEVRGIVFGGYPVLSITDGTDLELFSYNSTTNEATFTKYALTDETQPKLYRHVITLHANSTSDGSCRLEWISPNDLVCDSLEDLRTVLGNPQMGSFVASNPGGDLFGVVISPSTAQIKKVGTTSLLNITSVSDTVTPV